MKLPELIASEVAAVVRQTIAAATAVGGGCVSNTTKLRLENGEQLFLKWSSPHEHQTNFFAEEARSLHALAGTHTIRVPSVLHTAEDWLLLEWLEPGNANQASWRGLGQQLAQLHRNSTDRFGWVSDNFIGALPQSNREHHDWPAFWRTQRMIPQLDRAQSAFNTRDRQRLDRLIAELEVLLAGAQDDGPSLLHGDLWSGNVHMLADGRPALIDPSCYFGHREVDLAMTRLFGGFADEFYHAYDDSWPLLPNAERRMRVYQLYYLLVHVNLFGGSYVGSTMAQVAKLGY